MTSNHLLTLREDFSAPLRRSTGAGGHSSANSSLMLSPAKENVNPNAQLPGGASRKLSNSNVLDTSSEVTATPSMNLEEP